MKKKLLIVAHHMTVGGVQKTLISASKAIDYDKYDVTLYLRKNRTDLLSLVDGRMNVIINKDPNRYYRKPFALILQAASVVSKLFGLRKINGMLEKKLADKIREKQMEYEQKTYFADKKFDIAVAYVQGYTALFVDRYVNADKKILFFHTSKDELHEMHCGILPRYDKIAALHSEQKSLIEEWYPDVTGRIMLVENFTDKETVTEMSKEFSPDVPDSKTVLCSCGRFAPVKGLDLAVNSAKILKDKGKNFIWYFVGDGPERNRLEKMIADCKLENNIIITGMQKNPYPYMAACDIYVQPSYEEAMPVTILEAHRLNKPVVTTATVGGKKLIEIGKNGIITDITVDALSDGIVELIENNALYSEITENLESVDYSKDFEKYKTQWQNILN